MKISQFPKGYIGLLGVQDAGRSPSDLAEVVSPIVDFTQLYLSTTQLANQSSGNSPWTIGQSDNLVTIPQNETWVIKSVLVRATAAAATTMRLSVYAALNSASGIRVPLTSSLSLGSAVQENACLATHLPTLLLLPGGTSIFAHHEIGVAGAANAYFVSFLYIPLRQSV